MDINEEIKNLQEAFITLVEGRKEGESTEDFKHRLHGELVRDIDKKAGKAKEELLAGKGSYEKYKKEHDKLGKLDDIEPVANAYIEVKENADIMTQILDLQKQFKGLFESTVYHQIKKVHGEPEYKGSDSKPANRSAELLYKIDDAIAKERKAAVEREKKPGETSTQATYRVLGKRDPLDTVAGKQDAIAKYKKSGHEGVNPSAFKNESSDIITQILDLTEAYVNLLEANDKRGGAQKEVNKITRTKKDKNGEPIEVVSVADELFPYKGTAKEQYNQKILAKINDMIEGTATLDDLIQLVRSKKPAVNVKESLEEAISLMEAFLNEKNANVEKKHQWEINQAQAKRPKDEYVGDLGTVSGIKKSNQGTIYGLKRILKKTKNSKYSIGRESDTQALESGISKVAGISRDALGRKEPENPYKVPYMWCKAYETTHGNLNQKAIERNHSYDQGYKKHLKTSIEQEKKIKPKLPKPEQEK